MHQIDKLKILLREKNKLFHTSDLSLIWGISNKNTLYSTIQRYIRGGALFSLQKGLYSTLPFDKLDPVLIGASLIHDFSYLTAETVLYQSGIINQIVTYHTFVSSKSKKFKLHDYLFSSRQLAPKFLFCPIGVSEVNGVFVASPERAIADLLYFNPKYYLDNARIVNFKKVKTIQKQVGYIK